MRRFLTAFAAAVLMLSLGTADAAEYKKMTIRAATANPQGSLHVVAIDKFKEIVEKESNGAITVQTFYGGSLGDEQANVKQLRNAEIHLAVLADGNLTPFAPQAGVFILPYMFPKISDAEKLFGNEAFMNKTADAIAKEAEFFSFGTNDLTQMTFGFSRDDAAKFLGAYYENKIYESDPFQHLDQIGVGKLVKMAAHDGRETRPDLGLGICGEHGGDPTSVEFCHNVGLDYVSCSPFRVPIARLAAAQAAIKNPRK